MDGKVTFGLTVLDQRSVMKSAAGNPVKPLFATKWKESSKNQNASSEKVEVSCEEHWVCTCVHKNLKHWRVSFTDSLGCCLCLAELCLCYSRARICSGDSEQWKMFPLDAQQVAK